MDPSARAHDEMYTADGHVRPHCAVYADWLARQPDDALRQRVRALNAFIGDIYHEQEIIKAGLVFLADSRTSAGVDQINTFRKTTVFERPGDRVTRRSMPRSEAAKCALISMDSTIRSTS